LIEASFPWRESLFRRRIASVRDAAATRVGDTSRHRPIAQTILGSWPKNLQCPAHPSAIARYRRCPAPPDPGREIGRVGSFACVTMIADEIAARQVSEFFHLSHQAGEVRSPSAALM